jgi:excisionase family DNA binding protein
MSRFAEQYIKPSEIAKRLDMHRSGVYKLIQDGELPHIRIGRAVRVPLPAFEAFVRRAEAAGSAGGGVAAPEPPGRVHAEVQARLAAFTQEAQCDPHEFVERWKRGAIEDTPENAELAMDAISLRTILEREAAAA